MIIGQQAGIIHNRREHVSDHRRSVNVDLLHAGRIVEILIEEGFCTGALGFNCRAQCDHSIR